jgi:hypothetical protein
MAVCQQQQSGKKKEKGTQKKRRKYARYEKKIYKHKKGKDRGILLKTCISN